LLFIQCPECAEHLDQSCSEACKKIVQLPFEEQKALRKGKEAGKEQFSKGRSSVLKFKSVSDRPIQVSKNE
jgi:UPF0176 protein